ncbi:hypothetical protein [Streptomyces sp. NPDC057557]|uniref:hypothetical protein n=1 Tax=Streptomyces sp. NPDC057557 TaxID=3346167 RepID=UPI00369A3DE5
MPSAEVISLNRRRATRATCCSPSGPASSSAEAVITMWSTWTWRPGIGAADGVGGLFADMVC